jgi:hypothetical protein
MGTLPAEEGRDGAAYPGSRAGDGGNPIPKVKQARS